MGTGEANAFGALLRQHRTRAGLTQEELAERAGLSVRGLVYLERGTRHPYPDTLHRLAEALALDADARERFAQAAHEPVSPAAPHREEVRLAGRERELARLRARLDDVTAGNGGLVLIGGEAGIGKTTLAEATLREAATQGCATLVGHCFDLTETPPYGPFIDLFARYAPAPWLPAPPASFKGRGTVGPVPNQMALFVQVQDFLIALSRQRPTVMLLDDLHWADPASLDLLRFLARSVATLPLLILATNRSDELTRTHPLSPILPQLAREQGAERIALDLLNDEAVRTLIDERYRLPDADANRLVAYVQGRAEGNPLFVVELLRALAEGGALARDGDDWRLGDLTGTVLPLLLRQIIEGRVARLGDESQQQLAVAAVIGHAVRLDVWASVGEVDEGALFDVVGQGVDAHLLVESLDGEEVRFVHALVREGLYQGMIAKRRRRLHDQVGEALLSTRDPDPDAVAYHFQRAGDVRAGQWLAKAGERARAAHAYVTAVERMQEAVALLDRPEDAALAGSLCMQIGMMLRISDRARATRYSEEAIRRAEEANDPVLAGVARCRFASNLVYDGDYARGIAASRAGLAELTALPPEAWERTATPQWYIAAMEGDRSSVSDVRSSLAMPLAVVGACREALSLMGGTLDLDDAALATANVTKLDTLRLIAEYLGRPDVSKRMHEEYGHITRAAEDWLLLANVSSGFLVRTVLVYDADDLAYREEMASAAERALTRAQALHLVEPFPVRAVRFPLDFLAGSWDTVQTHAAVMHILRPPISNTAKFTLAMIARAQGRVEEARRYVREWLPEGAATEPGVHPLYYGLLFLHLGGLLALDADDLDGARAWAATSGRWLAWSGTVLGQSEGQALWAQYHRQAGDIEQAHEHAARALAYATEPRQPLALLAAHRLLGELDIDAGQFGDAGTHLNAALTLAAACQASYERALTLLAIAELRMAMEDTDTARILLAEVQAIFEPLGAKPALARTERLAARLAQA